MHEPQFITAPGGARLVVLPEADYLALIEAREDAADEAAAAEGLDSLSREGGIPADVLYAIQDGANPVAAWRQWHGMSQAELAYRAGLTQAAIARIESAKPGAGRPETRKAIATALGAPVWAFSARP
ncbi:MAG: helix-turn-helix transcriptional regulator [Sandaracinobacter sp.]